MGRKVISPQLTIQMDRIEGEDRLINTGAVSEIWFASSVELVKLSKRIIAAT